MLENNCELMYFLKSSKKSLRYIYLRVRIDGIAKETSTKRKIDISRWNQATERATGNKEDARTLNFFLDTLQNKINRYVNLKMSNEEPITSLQVINYANGNDQVRAKVIEEFKRHNDEMNALVKRNECAPGTHERYTTACSHVQQFIKLKFNTEDIDFRFLNYEFVKDYEFFLKTVCKCNNNTALKYIGNFKKIVLQAVAKGIIPSDPFIQFKGKKTKPNKRPLTREELSRIENKQFKNERLGIVRDIFIFQCYTGLAYIDVYQLRRTDIKTGIDGQMWIMSDRQKSKATTNIPLLPKALEIINKYIDHPDCTNKVLPVRTNQKMNAYLKEIADLCNYNDVLNTHKGRRTFGSTVTLNNGVPINVVKEMLGHHSIRQTEEYAITEQITVGKEMNLLKERLQNQSPQSGFEELLKNYNMLGEQLKQYMESDPALKSKFKNIVITD